MGCCRERLLCLRFKLNCSKFLIDDWLSEIYVIVIIKEHRYVELKMSSQKIHCWTLERVPPDLASGPPFVLDNAQEKIKVGRREKTNDKVRNYINYT